MYDTNQLHNYLRWQKERGQVYPVYQSGDPSLTPRVTELSGHSEKQPRHPEGQPKNLVAIALSEGCSPEAKTLLNKMLGAINLDAAAIPTQFDTDFSQLDVKPSLVLIFDQPRQEFPFGKLYRDQSGTYLRTYHPQTLLGNPGLKAPTWLHLQRAQQFIEQQHGH